MRPLISSKNSNTTTSVRISLVDSTVRNNLCHLSFDSNVKYQSNNITASSSRQYHAGSLIFWSTRTVIRKWSPCLPHKRDRWPAAEWKQYGAVWGGWRAYRHKIFGFIIHQIFSLAHDWSKRVTRPNIPQLKPGNIRKYSPFFKTARVAKKIWRIINTIASIWGENMFGYLSLDIICSSKLLGTDNVRVTNILAYFRAKWRLLLIHAKKALGLSV